MVRFVRVHLFVPNARHRTVALWALLALLVASGPAFAQTTVWTDGTGDWFTPTNWSAGVPNANTGALINNGGDAQITASGAAAGEVEIGVGAQDSGTLSVSASGDLQDGGSVYVGRSGTGNFNITDGGVVASIRFVIGENSGSNGTATVSGSGSMWMNDAVCFVGFDGNATLNITNGGQLSNLNSTSIGENGTGHVTVDGVGSTWNDNVQIDIGGVGSGTLTISNGGHVVCFNSVIGRNPGSNGLVTVSGVGSSWTNNGFLGVSGNGGGGTLQIMNGGAVSNSNCIVGISNGGGNVFVEGAGSTWTISGDLSVGSLFGAGGVTILEGGHLASVNGFIGEGSSSVGKVGVDGAASTWINSSNIYVGGDAVGAVGIGELFLNNGGTVTSPVVTVWSSGTLFGNGFIQTNEVANQGGLAPEPTISITGNLSFGLTADMFSTVTPQAADSVIVQGAANLLGDLNVTLIGGPFVQGTQYTLLLANAGLNGTTFSNVSISAPPGVAAQVTYDTNHVYLTIQTGGGSPTPTATGTPSATPTPSSTSTPTPTPSPTQTATPTPTATPSPTPTPTPGPGRSSPTPRPRPTPHPRP